MRVGIFELLVCVITCQLNSTEQCAKLQHVYLPGRQQGKHHLDKPLFHENHCTKIYLTTIAEIDQPNTNHANRQTVWS